jgi:hypothetical protein
VTAPGATEGPGDGNIYGAFVTRQLEDQRDLKDSLERRAAAVITTSGVLVTLLFALTTITTRRDGYTLPDAAHFPLYAALGAFVAACVLALLVSVPRRYRGASAVELEKTRLTQWWERDGVARRRVAGTEIVLIQSYRRSNGVKAWLLIAAGAAQILALLALGATVAIILIHH